MVSHQRVIRMFRRSATRIRSIAASAGSVVGLLALAVAAPPMEAQQQAEVRVPTAALERYVGEYLYPDGASRWVVSRTADTLFHEAPGRRTPFVPLSETLFRVGPVTTAEFVIDQAGGMTQILTDGVGIEVRLRRRGSPPESPDASSAPAPAAVRVPKSVLERYVGAYEFLPGQMDRTDLRVPVALRGDTLTRWMFGKEQVLVPISATRFRVAGTSLVTEFVIDDAGVTQVMGSGFQQLLARRTSKR